MDPVGPWTAYAASYNRLAGAAPTGDFPHHLASTAVNTNPSTTSQLLMQAHATSTLAGTSSAFNPGAFLSPPPVGYDAVFSPFLHHANQKAHYTQALNVAQHKQAIPNHKPGLVETDNLRENYNVAHQPLTPNPALFDQSVSTVQPPITWPHQNNASLPSPFGILPHESVVGKSAAPPTSKLSAVYENFNAAHFAAAQTLNQLNSHLVAATYSDPSKKLASIPSQSPSSPLSSPAVKSNLGYYQEGSPNTYNRSEPPSNQFLVANVQNVSVKSEYNIAGKVYPNSSSTLPVSSTSLNNSSSKEYNMPPGRSSNAIFSPSVKDKLVRPTAGFQPPTSTSSVNSKLKSTSERRDSIQDSNQLSPINFTPLDSGQQRTTSKISTSSRTISNSNVQLQQQMLNHQKGSTYRGYQSSTVPTPDPEYSLRNAPSSDGGYSSGSSVGQNGSELQQSPLNHSQPSPLGHVTSPNAYPIYHSPMTSMSSPSPVQQHPDQSGSYKQNPSPQVAPQSPLDATLSRPSSVGQVVHPSVITRNEHSYPGDRPGEFIQKQYWEAQNGKFSSYSSESVHVSNISQQQKGMLGLTERQQAYFDSASNHNNNRGDPKSIVKNLQNLQQQCQVPPQCSNEKSVGGHTKVPGHTKVTVPTPTKKKKSVNTKVGLTESLQRIPPPAHLNVNNNQQNNVHLEMDRWNSPLPCNEHANTPLLSHIQQHKLQTPYLQSFHQTPPQPYANTSAVIDTVDPIITPKVEIETIAKVIVPNVEEELDFLSTTPGAESKSEFEKNVAEIKPVIPAPNQNSSFMASFIKFLQGEKDSSPPPRRKILKATYIPSVNKNNQQDIKKEQSRVKKVKRLSPSPPPPSQDIEDDPRYFPLPKDSSSRKLGSSSDSEITDYDLLIPISDNSTTNECNKLKRESKQTNKRKRNNSSSGASRKRSSCLTDNEENEMLPRRSTNRKAKEKLKTLKLNDGEDTSDLYSSDLDPAWSPVESRNSRNGSDDGTNGRMRGGRDKRRPPKTRKPPPSRFLDSSDEDKHSSKISNDKGHCSVCNSSFDNPKDRIKCNNCKKFFHSSCCSLLTFQKLQKLGSKRRWWKCDSCKTRSENKKSDAKKNSSRRRGSKKIKNTKSERDDDSEPILGNDEFFPFKSGEFIVIKTDLKEEFPPIWRVDGKTLLQKYEPFDQNGEKLYRNISTYSGWAPSNRHIYEKIPVQFVVQSRFEIIVRFLRSEMVDPAEEEAFLKQSLLEKSKYQDNFEVYIQTLISQALDSNFLTEIFAEKDEYFLQNVEVIDRLTEERREQLVDVLDWPKTSNIQRSLATWPCYNVLADLKVSTRLCDACERSKVHARIILYGQPYNATTLDGASPTSNSEKDFMICLDCIKWVQLYNKLVHQKYIMYIECAKRVTEIRTEDKTKDTTVILNELLADENWLMMLFRQVRVIWADVEKAERERKRALGIKIAPPLVIHPEETTDTGGVEKEAQCDELQVPELLKEIKVECDESAHTESVPTADGRSSEDQVCEVICVNPEPESEETQAQKE